MDWETFIELSVLWNPYPSSAGTLQDQSRIMEACLHNVPQSETEKEKGGKRSEEEIVRHSDEKQKESEDQL